MSIRACRLPSQLGDLLPPYMCPAESGTPVGCTKHAVFRKYGIYCMIYDTYQG